MKTPRTSKAVLCRPCTTHRIVYDILDDCLYDIFLIIRDMASIPSQWVQINLVCRRWCNVSRYLAPLWTRLRISRACKPVFVSELLSRSKALDLIAEVDMTEFDTEHILKLVLDHAVRLTSLTIIFPLDKRAAVRSALKATNAQKLASLVARAYGSLPPVVGDHACAEPLGLDTCDIPALRHLRISNVSVTTANDILSKLTSLEISSFGVAPVYFRFQRLLAMLRECSLTLRFLTLDNLRFTYLHPLVEEPVQFERLQKLTLINKGNMCHDSLLTHFRIPLSASVTVKRTLSTRSSTIPALPDSTLIDGMFPFYRHQRNLSFPMFLHTRRLRLQVGRNFQITGWLDNPDGTVWRAFSDQSNGTLEYSNPRFLPTTRELRTLVKRDQVREFECHFAPFLPTWYSWWHVLGAFPKLHRFTFGGTHCIGEILRGNTSPGFDCFEDIRELELCMGEVADSTIQTLLELKRLRLCSGGSSLPPSLVFRLPTRLAQCVGTRARTAQLAVQLKRITQLRVYFLDCAFCHSTPKVRRLMIDE
ncbi:hypothetical protein C8Q79DRAFT_631528 [Trametes meyenii]|nr:hypothetical protein C8Q79DRAFT_631528 [Trametes meyenii]